MQTNMFKEEEIKPIATADHQGKRSTYSSIQEIFSKKASPQRDGEQCTRLIPEEDSQPNTLSRCLGFLCAFLSAFFFSILSLIIKILTEIGPFQLSFVRSVSILIPASLMVLIQKHNPCPRQSSLKLVFRSIVGAGIVACMFISVRYLPLSDSSVIGFSTPVFVAILARIVLKESFTVLHCIAIVMSLSGIILVVRPPFLFGGHVYDDRETLIGIIAVCVGVLLKSVFYILSRLLKDIPLSVLLFTFGVATTAFSAVLSASLEVINFSLSTEHWLLLVGLAVLGFLGQALFNKALQLEEAAVVSIVRSIEIVFAFVLQYLFLDETLNVFSVLGAVLVTLSVILVPIRTLLQNRN